jgi:hypothetical protein
MGLLDFGLGLLETAFDVVEEWSFLPFLLLKKIKEKNKL